VQSVELREELARRLSEGESIATEARGIVRQQQEVIASLQGKLGALSPRSRPPKARPPRSKPCTRSFRAAARTA
jgi:hypothetical protein